MEPNFQAIPQFTRSPTYEVDVPWHYLERTIKEHEEDYGLNLDPDFQRGLVWTPDQRSAFIEYCLKGGTTARRIYFNCSGWNSIPNGEYVLVDGKQRLHAIRGFLRNEVPAFGHLFSEFTGAMRVHTHRVTWCVNDLPTRKDVLQWYLEMNTGGTVHTKDELDKVRHMLSTKIWKSLGGIEVETGLTTISATSAEKKELLRLHRMSRGRSTDPEYLGGERLSRPFIQRRRKNGTWGKPTQYVMNDGENSQDVLNRISRRNPGHEYRLFKGA